MNTTSTNSRILYTAKTHTKGGRVNGSSRSSDGRLVVLLSSPASKGSGTNPEQLFAAGWSACFYDAMNIVAGKMCLILPADTTIDAEVNLCNDEGSYTLTARLAAYIPRMERGIAQKLIDNAQQICPYTKAIKGNMPVHFCLL